MYICPAFAHLYQIVKQKPPPGPVDHLQVKASGRMTEKFLVTQFSGILQWKGVYCVQWPIPKHLQII